MFFFNFFMQEKMNSCSPDYLQQPTSSNAIYQQQNKPKMQQYYPSDIHSGSSTAATIDQKLLISQLVDHLVEQLCPMDTENNTSSRRQQMRDIRSENVHKIFAKLEEIVGREYSHNRRADALAVLYNAKIIYLHLLYLKNKCEPKTLLIQQIETVLDALQQTTKFSHDDFYGPTLALENRKLQITLGLVEAHTTMFVLDIDTFGLQLNGYEKCSKLRRSIGNSLMNLVYQQREAKHKLCSNRMFLRRVADVIGQVHPLVQFYAGLIQNVSYNADQRIASRLAITVEPLVRTAIQMAYNENERKFDISKIQTQRKQHLLKILSALWNLAEDPIENKKVMCNVVPQFVPMLLNIMFSDQRELQFIQAAAGILKHLCTFILQCSDLFDQIYEKGIIIVAFMRQLASSSPDLVTDSLTAISILASHPFIAREILAQENYVQQIGCLVRSTNEGISRASRTLLDTIYSTSIFYQIQQPLHPAEMCASMMSWPIRESENGPTVNQNQQHSNAQYFTLPRTSQGANQQQQSQYSRQPKPQFADDSCLFLQQNTPKGVLKQQNQPTASSAVDGPPKWQLSRESQQVQKGEMDESDSRKGEKREEEEENVVDHDNPFIGDLSTETGHQDLPTSVQCTREVSPQSCSFNSENGEKDGQEQEWPSIQSTSVRSSGVQSTASASELPDSPSQWADHKVFQLKEMEMQILKALDENKQSGQCTNANVSGETGNQGTIYQEEDKKEAKNTEEEEGEGDDRIVGMPSCNLLAQVIRECMPKPGQPQHSIPPVHYQFTQTSTPVLTPISCNSPCKSPVRNERRRKGLVEYGDGSGVCGLLEESIAAVMPRNAPHSRLFGSRHTSGSETSPNQTKVAHNNSEDDDFLLCANGQNDEQISPKFPADVAREIGAQWIMVDCQQITNSINQQTAAEKFTPRPKKDSHIPILTPEHRGGKSGVQSGGNSAPKDQKAKLRISPQKPAKGQKMVSPKVRQPPPPLAPKPKVAAAASKLKRPQSSNSSGTGNGNNNNKESSTMENGQFTTNKIVSL